MKKRITSFLRLGICIAGTAGLLTGANHETVAQCLTASGGQYPGTTFTPTCNGYPSNITTNGWASEYSLVSLIAGETYTFTSSNSSDFLTIADEEGTEAFIFGTTPVEFTPAITGIYRMYNHTDQTCGEEETSRTRAITCGTIPPVPANDEASDAVSLTVNNDFNCIVTTPGTTSSATQSADVAPGCSPSGISDDVWYSFVATSASTHKVSVSGTNNTIALAIYEGSPGSLTPVSGACASTTVNVSGLTVGTTYYVRVYTTSTGAMTFSDFDICVGTPPPPPANDECANAVSINVNADQNCSVVTSGTVAGATASADAVTCSGTEDDDVWYSFTATTTAHDISLLNVSGSVTDMAMELLDGCGGANLICSDPNSFTATDLTVGSTYLLRIYTYTSTGFQNTTFDVCIGTPPPPPANDECANAVALAVNPDLNCGNMTSGTVQSATASADATTCSGTEDDDVWYSFTATASAHQVSLLNVDGSVTDMAMELLDGCGGVSMACSDPEAFVASGLTIGNTYLVRVYTYTSSTGQNTTFDICIGTLPPPPPNDECENAVDISGGAVINGTTYSATPTITEPECGSVTSNEVWYSVTTIEDGELTIDVINTSGDMVVAVYTGSCGALTNVACEDGPAIGTETVVIPGTVSGTTYLIRVFGYEGDEGNFTIQATGAPLPVEMDALKGRLSTDNEAILTWTTFREMSNSGFDMQRSENGKDFRSIAFVPSKAPGGNSTEAIHYQFVDQQKVAGVVFYRMIQQDIDGKARLSNIVRLTATDKTGFMVLAYPNPATDKLNMVINGEVAANSRLTVTDAVGKVVYTLPVTTGQLSIDMQDLPAGIYLLKYTDAVHRQVIKVTKQ